MAGRTAKYSGNTSRAAMARRKIMDTAARLFSERGYGGVGINEVGLTAGFGKGALYYHIRSKEDLLVLIISDQMGRLIASGQEAVESAGGCAEIVEALTRSFVEELVGNPSAMTVCHRDVHAILEPGNIRTAAELHERYRTIWVEVFRKGTAAGEHRPVGKMDVDAIVGMMFSAVFWFDFKSEAAAESLARTFSHTVISSVTSGAGT